MKVNDTIKIAGKSYSVLSKLGSGGQGSVWRVKCSEDNRLYAVKILDEKDSNRRVSKIANIKRLISEKADLKMIETVKNGSVTGVNHVCPIAFFTDPATKEVGYVMELASGKSLSSLLADGTIRGMSMERKLGLLKKVVASIERLHTVGYCYTDISFGNFMWDEKADMLYVIDCENIACTADINNGKCNFLIGTGFFIAPEVAFGQSKVGYDSDRYALATLLFRVLTDDVLQSAYHGVAMYSARPACQSMLEVADYESEGDIDRNWRKFVFDPTNRSNGLDNLCRNSKNPANIAFRKEVERVIAIWKGLDPRLKDAFLRTFLDPFDRKARLTASAWLQLIDEVLRGKTVDNSTVHVKKIDPSTIPQPQPQPQPSVKPARPNPIHKYPAFVPAGGNKKPAAVSASALPPKPYLIGTTGKTLAITADEIALDGKTLGLTQGAIGTIKRVGSGYAFTSQ
ncbi:MAG: hypothetical protein J5765_03395, partial [Clostridia bacterium]|nr:hypothetical protein [Clostridia bacterium]